MSNPNDMAFPVLDVEQTPNGTFQLGLTKREYIAAMAMQGICSVGETWPRANDGSHIAETAVQIADALIARLS